MKLSRNLAFFLLGAWLILNGLISMIHLSFSGLSLIMSILAVAAGALLIIGK
ncbi:MAG TPA: hypothetical protein VI159_07275 [Gemmatimonadales bacterium]|nr:hypothetical protein [Gemmatimonadales bacterium]HKR55297.1 hypothetical protein [Gemmatimonadales bacterium]HWH03827.1 hypothetical protein [Gemmatimonadales bacterium]